MSLLYVDVQPEEYVPDFERHALKSIRNVKSSFSTNSLIFVLPLWTHLGMIRNLFDYDIELVITLTKVTYYLQRVDVTYTILWLHNRFT